MQRGQTVLQCFLHLLLGNHVCFVAFPGGLPQHLITGALLAEVQELLHEFTKAGHHLTHLLPQSLRLLSRVDSDFSDDFAEDGLDDACVLAGLHILQEKSLSTVLDHVASKQQSLLLLLHFEWILLEFVDNFSDGVLFFVLLSEVPTDLRVRNSL